MKPFYLYHLVPTDADLSLGLITPEYAYEHGSNMAELLKEKKDCKNRYK